MCARFCHCPKNLNQLRSLIFVNITITLQPDHFFYVRRDFIQKRGENGLDEPLATMLMKDEG